MKNKLYKPLSIDCIDTADFPDVALHVKAGNNYVLYKPKGRSFTKEDRGRLQNNKVEFLYVWAGEMEAITRHLEEGLVKILANGKMDGIAKGKSLYQILVNYVADIFETTDNAADVDRCRKLIMRIAEYLNSGEAIAPLGALPANNYYIFAHNVQVAVLTMLVHREICPDRNDDLLDVGIGAILHDFGMVFICSDILSKPDALSNVEYNKVTQHVAKGFDFLKNTARFSNISLDIVRYHHEKFNGIGYPYRLRGESIPLSAQLTALTDVFCALTTDRVYRKAVTPDKAFQTMKVEMKGAFSETLLQRFEDIITSRQLM